MRDVGVLRRVSLITVLYGGADVIGTSIASAQAAASSAGLELEVILVDNAPGDGTAEVALAVAPDATVINNLENIGFGRACNQGFDVASGQWWLLLNPDARLEDGAMAALVAFAASHPGAGAVAPILTGAGSDRAESAGMQPGLRSAIGHFLFINRLLPADRGGAWRGVQVQRRPELGPRRVEWVSGGAVLLRPEAVQKVNGFDPSFFLYAEDIDLGRRIGEAAWESWLQPDAAARHEIAASSGGATDRWIVALHDLYAREASRASVFAFDLIAGAGLTIRAVASRDPLQRRRMAISARAVLRLAFRRAP